MADPNGYARKIGWASGDPFTTLTAELANSQFGGNGSSGEDTSGVTAWNVGELLKSQYEDWKNTFQPIELNALQQISSNNPAVLPNALDEAKETVSNAYGAMGGVLERQNRSLGIVPTAQQEATSKRLLNLNQAATTASAENNTRANVRQMDEMLLMGTTPNPSPGRTLNKF